VSTIVEIEDRLGSQLLIARIGLGSPPTLAGRYTLLELRGRGARGLVCRATDQKLGRDVALKIYPALEDARIEAEVMREARSLAKLEHPNVVGVIDFGQARLELEGPPLDVVYLCMEFIDGRSLRTWRGERARRVDEILDLLAQAGAGLAAAHGAGLVHRDFKPENVMIESRGRVLVVDFGLASSRGAAVDIGGAGPDRRSGTEPGDRLTQLGVAQGTIEYMAPEARRGAADAKSDQFSFAMAAWESLTGVLPFDVHEFEWRRPGQAEFIAARTLAPALRAVLERALSYFPQERYPSIVAMLQALSTARGARRRIAIGVSAAVGLVAVGTLATIVMRAPDIGGVFARDDHGDPERLAVASLAEAADDATGCAAAAGRWRMETIVVRSEGTAKFNDVQGWYELEVEALEDRCSMRVRVEKVGDSSVGRYGRKSKVGDVAAESRPLRDGALELGFDVDLTRKLEQKLLYRFDLELQGDEIRGDWHLTSATPLTGYVHGRRVAAPTANEGWPAIEPPSAYPCASQCRVVCDDAAAARRCVRDHCAQGQAVAISSCTAP
jgi:hypothetical protein